MNKSEPQLNPDLLAHIQSRPAVGIKLVEIQVGQTFKAILQGGDDQAHLFRKNEQGYTFFVGNNENGTSMPNPRFREIIEVIPLVEAN